MGNWRFSLSLFVKIGLSSSFSVEADCRELMNHILDCVGCIPRSVEILERLVSRVRSTSRPRLGHLCLTEKAGCCELADRASHIVGQITFPFVAQFMFLPFHTLPVGSSEAECLGTAICHPNLSVSFDCV
jgi:hypothetical protein